MTVKLGDILDRSYALSSRASESVRTLGLAGLAIVWLFSGGDKIDIDHLEIRRPLLLAGALFVSALTLDLLHSVVGSISFAGYARHFGSTATREIDVVLPKWLAAIPWAFYIAKIATLGGGYGLVLYVFWSHL